MYGLLAELLSGFDAEGGVVPAAFFFIRLRSQWGYRDRVMVFVDGHECQKGAGGRDAGAITGVFSDDLDTDLH